MSTATLRDPGDRDGFHRELARLLRDGVHPDAVAWICGEPEAREVAPSHKVTGELPPIFAELAGTVLLHHDADRFLRLHHFARRLHDDARHAADVLHPERRHLESLARQVRRDMHKMKAFVRFTRVEGAMPDDTPEYIAWFEPQHHIVEAMGSFFRRRFAAMRWSVLTPRGSLRWDGEQLWLGPAAHRHEAPPADAGQALWLTYYQHIFNPARVKVRAMQREMPVYYWKNLPEAALIPQLLAQAPVRTADMVARQEVGRRRAAERRGVPPPAADPLEQLQREIRACDACDCAMHATQAVTGEGAASARLMVVGEQPGDREDLTGRPFVGPAGELLRAALNELGVDPATVYLTNTVKHFRYEMRGKRRVHKTPAQQDRLRCQAWLERELAEVKPERVLLLGRTALDAMTRICQTEPLRTPQGAPIFVVAHPAALLRAGEAVGTAGYRRWVAQIGAMVA